MAENEAELRDEAERCLRALAGEHARLREDQWTAIRALVAERRRAFATAVCAQSKCRRRRADRVGTERNREG